jgi:hypothetical protein
MDHDKYVKIMQRMVDDHEFAHSFLYEQQQKKAAQVAQIQDPVKREEEMEKFNVASNEVHRHWREAIAEKAQEAPSYGDDMRKQRDLTDLFCTCEENHYQLPTQKVLAQKALRVQNKQHFQEAITNNLKDMVISD